MDRLAAETPRQIANAHTLFNVGIALLFLPAVTLFARFCEWVVPDAPLVPGAAAVRTKYLDDTLLATPSLALDRVRLEVLHAGEQIQKMLQKIMPALHDRDAAALLEVRDMDDTVDMLHAEIVEFLAKISKSSLTETQTSELIRLMDAVNSLENIGDIIERDLVELGQKLISEDVTISAVTQEVLLEIHASVVKAVDAAIQAVSQGSDLAAQSVTDMKDDINQLVDSAAVHEAQRLVVEEPNRIAAYTIEVDIIEKLKRIYYFAKRMAKTVNAEPDAIPERAA
jgi:phosphate:Na+ symporter